MKAQILRKIVNLTAGAALLTGIAYSGLALRAKPVYASSCNCTEELQDAERYCATHYNGQFLVWPFICPSGNGYYTFICYYDPFQNYHDVACD
jgi:hypothetical protein